MGKCNKALIVKLLCEFLASFFVQFIGCALTEESFLGISLPTTGSFAYAMSWGGSVLAATQAFRIVSGAHINPCISIASMILENVNILDGMLYILMQLLGSALGFGLSFGIFYDSKFKNKKFCCTAITLDPWWKAILLEFYMTGAWVFAMCASWHESNEMMLESISLRIGLVVVAATYVGANFTRSCMSPFRSLWPAIAAGVYTHIYVYVAVPPLTAILLAVAWRFLYLQGKSETVKPEEGGE
ncbi:aquaporin-like [Drosophila novamexicana]|uniref:aquaporin-like n=1 Tax=Drosophila novamexicana TaxID=47314 RepID=UPI0011E5BB75|nr:aquaporin-like [Drosophila novamexicana]